MAPVRHSAAQRLWRQDSATLRSYSDSRHVARPCLEWADLEFGQATMQWLLQRWSARPCQTELCASSENATAAATVTPGKDERYTPQVQDQSKHIEQTTSTTNKHIAIFNRAVASVPFLCVGLT